MEKNGETHLHLRVLCLADKVAIYYQATEIQLHKDM